MDGMYKQAIIRLQQNGWVAFPYGAGDTEIIYMKIIHGTGFKLHVSNGRWVLTSNIQNSFNDLASWGTLIEASVSLDFGGK
jgi:hypothetical protein